MFKKSIIFFFFFSFILEFYSQNLEKHQWKNRVVLLISSEENNKLLSKQIEILKQDSEGLKERKLIIYEIYKDYYLNNCQPKKQKLTQLYSQFNPKNQTFKIVLIGLDGGVKFAQTNILSVEKLFTLIDGMPMRRYEIKSKN